MRSLDLVEGKNNTILSFRAIQTTLVWTRHSRRGNNQRSTSLLILDLLLPLKSLKPLVAAIMEEATEAQREEARESLKPALASFGRRVWFTLESSIRADSERAADLESRLESVGAQVEQMREMMLSWMKLGKWEQRQNWTDNQWVDFIRSWQHLAGHAFEEDVLTEEEKELMHLFLLYLSFFAHAPNRPENASEGSTMEPVGQKMETQLDSFQENLGDPLTPCACCQKCALGYKLHRCSRCKRAHYCSRECQSKHWKRGHKRECKPSPTAE